MGAEEQPRHFKTMNFEIALYAACTVNHWKEGSCWEAIQVVGYEGEKLGKEFGEHVAHKDG